MTPRELIVVVTATETCWQCGRAIPNGFVRRRVMQTERHQRTSIGTGFSTANTVVTAPVSLCPRCDDAETERQARLTQGRSWGLILVGCTWLAFVFFVARMPIILAAALLVVLVWRRCVGRTILALYAVLGLWMWWDPQVSRYHTELIPPIVTTVGAVVGLSCIVPRILRGKEISHAPNPEPRHLPA